MTDLPRTASTGRSRAWLLAAATMLVSLLVTLGLAELMVRWLEPQQTMAPRSKFSAAYGLEFHPNRVMVQELAGQWRFEYTVNAQGHRGPVLPLASRYPRPVVVALGDSYTFGYGIADGQEYPNQLRERLVGSHDIVNLGTGGWGLTQHVRRFYELGRLYDPQVVVLQFCANDPGDNLLYDVARVNDGRIVFQDRDESTAISIVKRLLSDSFIQNSHLYAFARARLYLMMRQREIAAGAAPGADAAAAGAALHEREQAVHNELLEAFARDLARRRIQLLLIHVNTDLDRYPKIRERMLQLQAEGLARFVDIDALFRNAPHDLSPEGHWGPAAHRTVAAELARVIAADAAGSPR